MLKSPFQNLKVKNWTVKKKECDRSGRRYALGSICNVDEEKIRDSNTDGSLRTVKYGKSIMRERSASELLVPQRTQTRSKRVSHRLTGKAMKHGGA